MALLPYEIDVDGNLSAVSWSYRQYAVDPGFPPSVNWCIEQWPYTGGATWTWHNIGQVLQPGIDRLSYYRQTGTIYPLYKNMLRFTFQFKEDFILFRMCWGDLSPNRLEIVHVP